LPVVTLGTGVILQQEDAQTRAEQSEEYDMRRNLQGIKR